MGPRKLRAGRATGRVIRWKKLSSTPTQSISLASSARRSRGTSRIARLTQQVDTLRDFEARLHTPALRAPVARALLLGCIRDRQRRRRRSRAAAATLHGTRDAGAPGHADAARTREQLDCLTSTLSALEHETADHAMAYAAFPGRMPANGARFGSPFGNRSDPFTHHLNFHSGVDLVAKTGTPILAAAGGRVVFAGEKSGYGNAVENDHGNGLMTLYGHASRIVVRAGELVLPRQYIPPMSARPAAPRGRTCISKSSSTARRSTRQAYLALFSLHAHG